jgi:putative membrane protein
MTRTPFTPVALATVFLALGPAAGAADPPMKPSRALQAVMDDSVKDFFETAASAGQFEIEAGRLAQSKGMSPEVKRFAEKMVEDHTKAAKELGKIAADKGVPLSPSLLRRHEKMLDHLKKAEAGKDFDGAYRREMIASHKEAVSLFDEAGRKSADEDVKAFANRTLPTLQHHGSMAGDLPKP